VTVEQAGSLDAPWRCPVCRTPLALRTAERRWACSSGHSFDVAREGYVNLLVAGQRRGRSPGDSAEMVQARRRFLATGAFDRLTEAVATLVEEGSPSLVVDVGCGEGRHTRGLRATGVLGVDVAKPAVALAARAHRRGSYAVASAADLPLGASAVDAAVVVFGPVFPGELARVVRTGGAVVVAHPGPAHLAALRSLVYADPHPHEDKAPLRHGSAWFEEVASTSVTFTVEVSDPDELADLFTMTPYRWHAPVDVRERLAAAAREGFRTVADVRLTTSRRTPTAVDPPPAPASGTPDC